MTALTWVPLKSGTLLLAGEGPFLHIYAHDKSRCLASDRVLHSQSIHGIIYFMAATGSHSSGTDPLVLVWGGRSICLLRLGDHLNQKNHTIIRIERLSSIIRTDDWILDVSFRPEADTWENVERNLIQVVIVTSQNCLQYLRFQAFTNLDCKYEWCLRHLAVGPKSMLYSAHIVWTSTRRALVAAGTVFGEVFLWSFHWGALTSNPEHQVSSYLHYKFQGHEGSVFGVRISEKPTNSLTISAGRCLASCSDDRTIRVWDISQIDTEPALDRLCQALEDGSAPHYSCETSNLPMAIAMGHDARIWGLRFLHHDDEGSLLLSFGEDATSQIWQLQPQSNVLDSKSLSEIGDAQLQHMCTFEYHSKKNIWSAAAHMPGDGDCVISTGGADGRIVCVSLNDYRGLLRMDKSRTAEWTMSSVLKTFYYDDGSPSFDEIIAAKTHVKLLPEHVFAALEGNWKLYRRLTSEINTYPSGSFNGTAFFETRSPTDPAYDAEYLYVERGEFVSEKGLIIPATRRYVYRFQRDTETISAWFVKAEDGSHVDYLFHNVNFTSYKQESYPERKGRSKCLLEADGQHLCVDDEYQANYHFQFQYLQCDEWELKYSVNGPKKDYTTSTRFIRDDSRPTDEDVKSEGSFEATLIASGMKETGEKQVISDAGAFKTYTWVNEDQLLVSTSRGFLLVGNVGCSGTQEHGMAKHQIKPKGFWANIGYVADLEPSSLATNIEYPGIALLTGRQGIIYIYKDPTKPLWPQVRVPNKVSYLKSHLLASSLNEVHDQAPSKMKLGIIAFCLRPLAAYVLYLNVDFELPSHSVSLSLVLTLRTNFIVTSSCFANMENILILGSRHGALAIYEVAENSTDHMSVAPSCVVHAIHGNNTITVIENLPGRDSGLNNGTYFLTAGKDGTYSIHLITVERQKSQDTSTIGFQTVHVCKPPFGPNIEGACFNRTTKELWLWGFSSKDFVVWNETLKARVMTVECGGAHRNWAFLPGHGVDAGGKFAWTKASSSRIYSQPRASHRVLQHGGHGREIKAIAISPLIKTLNGHFARFVATGAEDTAIRIFHAPMDHEPQGAVQGLRCVGIFTKHTSGPQQLRWSPNGQLLFSAAGCEEFFVWRVRPVPCVEIGVMCEAICPPVTESADLRIMGFDVVEVENGHEEEAPGDVPIVSYLLSMAYSDSTVRVSTIKSLSRVQTRLAKSENQIYAYDSVSTSQKFHLLFTGSYTAYCLTKVLHLPFKPSIHLCTASTDGHLSFWQLTNPLAEKSIIRAHPSFNVRLEVAALSIKTRLEFAAPLHHPKNLITWTSRTRIHQNSIQAISSLPLSPSTFLLATGGDDGALAFTRVTEDPCPVSLSTSSTPPQLELQLQRSVLLIPNAHAAAITAITYLGRRTTTITTVRADTRRNGTQQQQKEVPWHIFATTSPDQKIKTWRVRIDLGKTGVEGMEVERGEEGGGGLDTTVADASCLEGFGFGWGADGDGDGDEVEVEDENEKGQTKKHKRKILIAGIGLEIRDLCF